MIQFEPSITTKTSSPWASVSRNVPLLVPSEFQPLAIFAPVHADASTRSAENSQWKFVWLRKYGEVRVLSPETALN
jgi:hypothetical protein